MKQFLIWMLLALLLAGCGGTAEPAADEPTEATAGQDDTTEATEETAAEPTEEAVAEPAEAEHTEEVEPTEAAEPTEETAEPTEEAATEPADAEARIESAMSAAPMAISDGATIVDYPAGATDPLIVLREGSNGWTCFPDWDATPGNDPQCFDERWMQWFDAISTGTEPEIDGDLGLAYMTEGGSDASHTDPFALEPAEGEDWVTSPPHVMLLVPGDLDPEHFSTDHHSGEPYIMWEGTPYEHIMMPIEVEDLAQTDDKIESAMSAAPPAVSEEATIVDYPAGATDPLIVLREGSNGWTCFPDWDATPGNDPQCFDERWMQWFDAISTGTEPEIDGHLGLAYMLQGGSDASHTDPFALEPAEGEDWVTSPPHVMLLVPGDLDPEHFSTNHHSGEPYIMWEGTPYEHIMMPIAELSE